MIDTILLVVAAGCFFCAAFGVKIGNLNFIPLGLLAWVLTALI